MNIENSAITKFWSMDCAGQQSESDLLRAYAKKTFKIIKRLGEYTLGNTTREKTFKNFEVIVLLIKSSSSYSLDRESVLTSAKLASELLVKYDTTFGVNYCNDDSTDPKLYKIFKKQTKERSLFGMLHNCSWRLLADAFHTVGDKLAPIPLDRLQIECTSILDSWEVQPAEKQKTAMLMFDFLFDKRKDLLEHPNVSKLFYLVVEYKGISKLWKFGKWYLKADPWVIRTIFVMDNLFKLYQVTNQSRDDYTLIMSAKEFCQIYESLMTYEKRKKRCEKIKAAFHKTLLEKKFDWENHNPQVHRHYLEAIAEKLKLECKKYKIVDNSISHWHLECEMLFWRLELYTCKDVSLLQWRLWAENLLKPNLKGYFSKSLNFRKQCIKKIRLFDNVWKELLELRKENEEELSELSEENKIFYLRCHLIEPNDEILSSFLKYALLAVAYALQNEEKSYMKWLDELNGLSEEAQKFVACFWLGECSLTTFSYFDKKILDLIMPTLLQSYSEISESTLLQALKATTDVLLICEDKEKIFCHRAFLEPIFPFLPWVPTGEIFVFQVPALPVLIQLFLHICDKPFFYYMNRVLFSNHKQEYSPKQLIFNAVPRLLDEELVKMLAFMKCFGERRKLEILKESLMNMYNYRGSKWFHSTFGELLS